MRCNLGGPCDVQRFKSSNDEQDEQYGCRSDTGNGCDPCCWPHCHHVGKRLDLHGRPGFLIPVMQLSMFRTLFRGGWLAMAFAVATAASAQGRFVINGKLKVEGGGLDGCRMVVYKEGVKHRTVSSDLNKFSLELDLNSNYVLSFEKNGFVTKKLSFNTQIPTGAPQSGFTPFEFVVSLFKQYDGMNTVVFNQPVGMIRYDEKLSDFDYDTDYTKSIQSALDEAQAAVEEKQKAEAAATAQEAKRKEQEAKEQAKAAARAAKDAEAKAKAQAKAAEKAKEPEKQAKVEQPVQPPTPVSPPPQAPVAARRKQEKPAHVRKLIRDPVAGSDGRAQTEPRINSEPSPVQAAAAHASSEPRPKFEATPSVRIRHQDVIVEPNQVITVVRMQENDVVTEYRKVIRKYSGTFYFKDGKSCSQHTYESEALAEVK